MDAETSPMNPRNGTELAICATGLNWVPATYRSMPGAKTWAYEAALATPRTDSVVLVPSNGTEICCDQDWPDESLPVTAKTTTEGTVVLANPTVAVTEPRGGMVVLLNAVRAVLDPLMVKPVTVVPIPASSR